ncbi:hypothetical protein TUBRATIS_001780 [Tubulinosema ratisbonensis]|uniref:Peptidase M48 domain-containing protein n=1 Tax=Tubulinosema ratisbonensis TaxID=291195 RepID=A0A437APX3_9MICR|nr:hypothetical protein TUBRATIS_001780 [Tubulinosema ratisbonensis]
MNQKRNYIFYFLSFIYLLLNCGYFYDLFWLYRVEKDFQKTIDDHIPSGIRMQISQQKWDFSLQKIYPKHVEQYKEKILMAIIENIFLFIINLLFYKTENRTDLFTIPEYIFDKLNLVEFKNDNVFMVFYFVLFYSFSVIRLNNAFGLENTLASHFFGIVLGFFLVLNFLSKNPKKIKFLYLALIIFVYFLFNMSLETITNTLYFRNHKKTPPFLVGESLEKVKECFHDNIYFDPNSNFGCYTHYFFSHFKISFEGNYIDITREMVLGLVCHEIGHANHIIYPIFELMGLLIKILVVFLYFKIFKLYSKNADEGNLSRKNIAAFVYVLNLPILFMFYNFFYMIICQSFELYADYISVKIAPKGELSSCLLFYNYRSGDFIFRPFFFSILNFKHPPTYLRIKFIEYLKSRQ